jgi:hypothetical protein
MRHLHRLLYGAALLLLVGQHRAFAEPQGTSQLYLATGLATRDDDFHAESTILGVDANRGTLVPTATFVNATEGSAYIIADHERRLLVAIGPNDNPNTLTVLKMDAPAAPSAIPFMLDGPLLGAFLCASDGKVFAALSTFQPGPSSHLIGIDLTGGDTSQSILGPDECKVQRVEGAWEPGDSHPFHNLYFRDGRFLWDSKVSASDIGITPPANFVAGNDRLILEIDNDEMLVIGRFPQITSSAAVPAANNTLLIYDKKKGMWRNRTIGTDGAAIRGFGPWIVTARAELKRAVVNGRLSEPRPQSERESPGSAFRRNPVNPKSSDKQRITVDNRFQESPFYFAGELALYNVDSQREYTIKTGQGDSEILLVDGDTVYYRVNDTLYKAQIGQAKIEDPQPILRDDLVQLSHWAFIGPSVRQ